MKTVLSLIYTLALCLAVAFGDTECVSLVFIENHNPCGENTEIVKTMLDAMATDLSNTVCGGTRRDRTLKKETSRQLPCYPEQCNAAYCEANDPQYNPYMCTAQCSCGRRLLADNDHQDQFAMENEKLEIIEDQEEVIHDHRKPSAISELRTQFGIVWLI